MDDVREARPRHPRAARGLLALGYLVAATAGILVGRDVDFPLPLLVLGVALVLFVAARHLGA